jgi:hypothetical protein
VCGVHRVWRELGAGAGGGGDADGPRTALHASPAVLGLKEKGLKTAKTEDRADGVPVPLVAAVL